MRRKSYARHRFPPAVICRSVWLYCRFSLSFRDVGEMLAEREGEVPEVLTRSRRNRRAALKPTRKPLKRQRYIPDETVSDKPGSYSAALRDLGLAHLHVTGGRPNLRAKVARQPTRRRARRMGWFKSPGSMQRFLSVHDAIYNHFNLQRHPVSRRILRQTRQGHSLNGSN